MDAVNSYCVESEQLCQTSKQREFDLYYATLSFQSTSQFEVESLLLGWP